MRIIAPSSLLLLAIAGCAISETDLASAFPVDVPDDATDPEPGADDPDVDAPSAAVPDELPLDDTGGAVPAGPLTLAELMAGDLLLTELMIAPTDCAEAQAEYIEIHNLAGAEVDLFGLELTDRDGSFTLEQHIVLGVDSWTLATRAASTGQRCYGLQSRFSYEGIELGNEGDELGLYAGDLALDVVSWSAAHVAPGAAWSLDVDILDAVQNDDRASWCAARPLLAGATGDRGTAGSPNDACETEVLLPDPPAIDTDPPVADSGTFQTDWDTGLVDPEPLVLISEVAHQQSPELSYVELYNPGPGTVSLGAYRLLRYTNGSPGPSDDRALPAVTLQPGHAFVVSREEQAARQAYETQYGPADMWDDVALVTGDDALILVRGSMVVDALGQAGIDGSGLPWEYTGSVAKRRVAVSMPTASWSAAEWIIIAGSAGASPGARF